jgi:hypothetical protein
VKFYTPNYDTHFHIPDDWWSFCDMPMFIPEGECYNYDPEFGRVIIVNINAIKPPRLNEMPVFEKHKMIPVLLAIGNPGGMLPPVEVAPKSLLNGYSLEVLQGIHRFYASIAVGYSHIPVVIYPRPA